MVEMFPSFSEQDMLLKSKNLSVLIHRLWSVTSLSVRPSDRSVAQGRDIHVGLQRHNCACLNITLCILRYSVLDVSGYIIDSRQVTQDTLKRAQETVW